MSIFVSTNFIFTLFCYQRICRDEKQLHSWALTLVVFPVVYLSMVMPITNHLALSSTNVVVSAGFSQNSVRHEDSWKVMPLILEFLLYYPQRRKCLTQHVFLSCWIILRLLQIAFKANLQIEAFVRTNRSLWTSHWNIWDLKANAVWVILVAWYLYLGA